MQLNASQLTTIKHLVTKVAIVRIHLIKDPIGGCTKIVIV